MKAQDQDFIFEATLIQYNDRGYNLRSNELYDVYDGMHPDDQAGINSTDLYFICKKPRLRIITDSLYIKDNNLHIGFELSLKEGSAQQFCTINNYPLNKPRFKICQLNNSRIGYNQGTGTVPIEWLINYLCDIHANNPSA